MADGYISQIKLPNEETYDFRDRNLKVYTGSCSTAAGTAIKDVITDGIFTLEKGAVLFVNFTNTNSAAVGNLKLKINGEADTNAKPIKYLVNGNDPANIPGAGYLRANQTYMFRYDGTNWVADLNYYTYSNDFANKIGHYNNILARKAIAAESLIVGDETGYEKVASGVTFNLAYPIVWCTGAVNANASNYANMFLQHYDRNIATGAKSGFTSTANKAIYLIVTINGNIATIDSNIITDTLPSSDDGKVYISLGKLGAQSTGANYFFLYPVHPMFWYKNGAIREYSGASQYALAAPLSGISGADDLKAIEAIGETTGLLKKTAANTWTLDTSNYVTSSGITSVTIGATSPVQSSTSTAQNGSSASTTISLKDAYGDTKNPYGAKAKNLVLAGPASGNNAAPTFRALVAADIPDISGTYVKKVTSTDNAIARFDSTSGQIQNSGIIIDDNNNITAGSNRLLNNTEAPGQGELLLTALGFKTGYPVYTDPTFLSGNNSVSVYNNSGGGTVTHTRGSYTTFEVPSPGTGSDSIIKIETTGTASPGCGGFILPINARANAQFIQIFRALVPAGRNLTTASNTMGTNFKDEWLTSRAGTGKWEWYARRVICGQEGTMSVGGHVYIDGAIPVTWYLASCNVYDITKTEYDGLKTRYADAANLTSTINAIAYYTDTTGTFGSKASANGALYATSANGALQWGTLPIAQGGTGKTTANDAANSLISGLPAWTANPTDDTYLIRRDTGGTATYGQVKFSTVWNYIKSKADSIYADQTTVNGLLAAADAMIFKGTLDGAATSSNGGAGGLTPAANCGDTYKVATIGYINGEPVEVGDIIICTTDSTIASTSSNYSTVKANWVIVQNNVDGAIFKGTNGFTDTHVIIADGTNGKVKDSGFTIASSVPANAKFTDTTSFTITANATDGYWDLTGTNGTNAVTYALTPYSSKQSGANFYTGTANPDGTTRLNYNGYLYATKLYSNGTEVSVSGHTHDYAGSSSAGGAATSANALNFVHTNELLLGNANSQSGIHINHRRVSGGATSGNTAITDYYFKNGNGAVTGVTIHAAAFDGSATSAGKWTTARNISISDSDGTNTGTAVSVDGSEAVTLKLPATIKADITGDAATVNGLTVQTAVPANAVFTDTNKYHKTGSWSGLTYTATAVNSADELKFTIPNKIQTNWELNATSGNSPALLFTRDGTLTDWKVFVNSGKLSFQSATNGTTWTERAYFKDNSGDFVATSFTGNGSALTSLNASNISSGTLNLARLGNQNANYVLAGPTSGNAAAPSFRTLVTTDIPDLGSIYIKKSAELLTTNPFAPASLKGPYISKIDNAFYAADKRWTVTANGLNAAVLFDGSYETQTVIAAGNSATILMDFDPNHNNSAYFPGYPYGYILISFYYTSGPASITGRVYCNYSSHGIGWHDIGFSPVSDNGSANIVYKSAHQGYYNISQLEITITAPSSNNTGITQIEMHLDRPDSSRTPFLSKYNAETLYYNLTAPKFIGALQGNADTATSAGKWTTARTLTIGNKGQSVDGSGNVSWSLADIGAAPVVSGGYLPLSGGQMTGPLTWKDSTALPETTSGQYFLVIDAFASGGTTKWIGKANALTSLGAAPSSHKHAASDINSGTFDTARIPNLSWNKITSDKPTTISGYGITDAKIASGVITLGSNTITPVTSVNGHSGSSVSVTASDLGLASALKYVGTKSSLPVATDSTTYSTYNNGDVITVSTKEYAYVKGSNAAGSSWVELGDEGSYKLRQTAFANSTGTADGTNTSTSFIYSFSQNENGAISDIKTRQLPTLTNVSYTATAATDDNEYPVLMKNSTGSDTTAAGVRFASGTNQQVTINPSTGTVSTRRLVINNSSSNGTVPDLVFSRTSWSYINIPDNDAAVLAIGRGTGDNASQKLIIQGDGTVRPGSDNTQVLGKSTRRWQKVYGVNFYGTFNGTATSAQQLAAREIDNSDLNQFSSGGALKYAWVSGNNNIDSKPTDVNAFGVIAMKTAASWTGQLLMSTDTEPGLYWRTNLTTETPSYGSWTPLASGNGGVYYGTCTTAADVAAKVVVCKHYHTLKAGDIIVVTFTNSNTQAQPTLNVNNTGAVSVKMAYSGGIVDLGSTSQLRFTCTFIYDGTYWLIINQQNAIQLATSSGNVNWRSVLLSDSNSVSENFTPSANTLGRTYAAHNVKYQPSTGTLRAPIMKTPKVQIEYDHVNKAHIEWNDTDSSIDFIFD